MANDDFLLDPEQFDSESQHFTGLPTNVEAAWILELIQVRLKDAPIKEEFKRELITYMTPYLNLAGMTNISRGQVIEFWMGYQKLWTKYRIFMNPDQFDSNLIFLKDWILEMFMLMLNKSIDGWQGDRVFERRHVYDVKQRKETSSDRMKSWFKGKRSPPDEKGEY